MADNWSDFYSGSMAPPLKTPGGYAPAPSSQSSMSPEEIYAGIYGEALRASPTVSGGGGAGLGSGVRATAQADYMRPAPNQPAGTVVASKDTSRLPANAFGYGTNGMTGERPSSAVAAIENAAPRNKLPAFTGSDPFNAYSGDYAAKPRFASGGSSNPVHRHNVNVSDEMGQSFADGLGMAVVTPNGKTYKPKIEGSSIMPSGNVAQLRGGRNNVSGSLTGNDTRGPLSQMLGLKTSGLGGLLGGLFGGMQQRQALGQVLGMAPGVGSAVSAPSLGYNAAYAQSAGGDGQGNNGISESGGRYGGARSLTS